ncbi:hypothetical protein DEU56DRAFT_283900 [Suillus clintonianus]|uniref:uncharacterized protein n=1 Tax=Suillus clintonianus TaxID=1904413 RepID=UPI001B85BE8E|nr:uncharacterized protein DEU56DRAFT_283900 [Suillus clintonianus]KAG2141105.1 hypothetical protein DEU56DRAFT_283900 [Suillus clintonianus]
MTFSKGIPLDSAAIMSTVLEGMLYGFSVLMFIGTIWTLTYKRHIRDVNRPITAVTVLLLVLSTAHMVVDIIRTEDGLVKYRSTFSGSSAAFFADVPGEIFVIKNVIFVLQTLVADGVVIYRCYVVWQTVWVIILPSILWCSVAAIGVYSACNFSQVAHIANISSNVTGPATREWILTFYALEFVTNLLSSGLLAFRIWKIERSVSTARTTKVTTTSILRVVVDAAIVYSIALLCTLITSVCSNNGIFVMIDILMPIISIVFYMVMIRIAISRNSHILTVRGGSTSETNRGNLQQYPLKPMQVHISQFTHNDGASMYRNGNQDRPSTGKEVPGEGASYNV